MNILYIINIITNTCGIIFIAILIFKGISNLIKHYKDHRWKKVSPIDDDCRIHLYSHPATINQEPLKQIEVKVPDEYGYYITYKTFFADYCFVHEYTCDKYYIFFPPSEIPFFQRLPGEIKKANGKFLKKHFGNNYKIVDYKEALKEEETRVFNFIISAIRG